MAKTLDQILADMAADGITVSVRLANPDADSPARLIGEAAQRVGMGSISEPNGSGTI